MKLSTWAGQQGLSYKTAWRLWKAGKLPVPAEQLATGTVIIHSGPVNEPPGVALYARVSSGEQECRDYCYAESCREKSRQLAVLGVFAPHKSSRPERDQQLVECAGLLAGTAQA